MNPFWYFGLFSILIGGLTTLSIPNLLEDACNPAKGDDWAPGGRGL